MNALDTAAAFIAPAFHEPPEIALVLGSGLGDYADTLERARRFGAGDIPSFPAATVPGHRGGIVAGSIGARSIIAFPGRIHLYECDDISRVLFPVGLAARLGARTLIVTNAAGGINPELSPGDLMLITDQIDLTLHREIPGGNRRGPCTVYDAALANHALRTAALRGIGLRRGVYAAVKGPSYETAAEVEMIRRLGGDAIGMSTVKETAHARKLGLRVLGISCITNRAAGTGSARLTHDEVTDVAGRVSERLKELLTACIDGLPPQAEGNSR